MSWWQVVGFSCAVVWVLSIFLEGQVKQILTLLREIEGELRDGVDHLRDIRDYLRRIDRNTPDPGFWIDIQDLKGRTKPETKPVD